MKRKFFYFRKCFIPAPTLKGTLLGLVLIFSSLGCTTDIIHHAPESSLSFPKDYLPTQHILMFEKEGKAVDPTGHVNCIPPGQISSKLKLCHGTHVTTWPLTLVKDYQPLEFIEDKTEWELPKFKNSFEKKLKEFFNLSDPYDYYLFEMFLSMDRYFEAQKGSDRKVLFYVHGGLNTQVETLKRVVQIVDECEKDKVHEDCNKTNTFDKRIYKRALDKGYYPIFINWHSWIFSTYFEQIGFIRQGRRDPYGFLTLPTYIFMDLARAISRAPIVWLSMGKNNYNEIPNSPYEDKLPDEVAKEILCKAKYHSEKQNTELKQCLNKPFSEFRKSEENIKDNKGQKFAFNQPECGFFNLLDFLESAPKYGPEEEKIEPLIFKPDQFRMSVGKDMRKCKEFLSNSLQYSYTFPFKLLTAPIIDTFGTTGFQNMVRRAHLLFHTEGEYTKTTQNKVVENNKKQKTEYEIALSDFKKGLTQMPASGGISRFMRIFAQVINLYEHAEERRRQGPPIEITLVGHSMGTIILNEMVRKFNTVSISTKGTKGNDETVEVKIPFQNIVYLAAACSIKDFEDSIVPYLLKKSDRTPPPHFYNLMLHRKAEILEENLGDFIPRGSLLVWLDDFLANPVTHRDRTLGRFVNFMPSIHELPIEVRSQIYVKVFGAGKYLQETHPQKHTHLGTQFKFWEEKCWNGEEMPEKNCFIPRDYLIKDKDLLFTTLESHSPEN